MEPYRLCASAARITPPAATPRAPCGGDPADISRSWQRCRAAGLIPEQSRTDAPHQGGAQLRLLAERNAALISQARPVMTYFQSQIKNSDCVILLSDAQGFLLDAAGDAGFSARAAKVALSPGACWAEDQRGTNAVGTALIEGRPVVVHGTEHYLRSHNFLACAAAPLTGPAGTLLGVIDISCDARIYHPHTFALVRAAAQMIETRMFEIAFAHEMKLRFSLSRDGLGTMLEGAIAIGAQGQIIGANRAAMAMLGLRPEDIGTREAAPCFDLGFTALMDMQRRAQGEPWPLSLRGGHGLHVRFEGFAPAPHLTPAPAAAAGDALGALDTGDERMAGAIAQLRRMRGRSLPILLQGETGTGKDMLARAIHETGPHPGGPFITVTCADLAERPGDDEWQSRWRAAQGGTLYLDGAEDLPAAQQARLLHRLEDAAAAVQLICAMRADIGARIAAQRFRPELYYRLNGLGLALPPLRARTDLAALEQRILVGESGHAGRRLRLSSALISAFAQYAWPGNLRELQGWLRAAWPMLGEGAQEIDLIHLSAQARAALTPRPAPAALAEGSLRAQSDAAIAAVLAQKGGNIAAAARHLRISRNTLYRRLGARRPAST